MNEKAPLLPTGHRGRLHCLYIIPYALLLIGCVLFSFIPLVLLPERLEESFMLRFILLIVPDWIQDALWQPLRPLLNEFSYAALQGADDVSTRRSIRKSDSLNAVLKGVMLKVAPTIVTIIIALRGAGFPIWLAFLLALVGLIVMGLITFSVFLPLVKMMQECKVKRDDAVEINIPEHSHVQTKHTASMKTNANLRSWWQACLVFTILVCCSLSNIRENSMVRLAHQVYSVDQTYGKIAQSLPKAIRIMSAAKSNGGILYNLSIASAEVWKVKPVALFEVDEFCLAGRCLAFLRPDRLVASIQATYTSWNLKHREGRPGLGLNGVHEIV